MAPLLLTPEHARPAREEGERPQKTPTTAAADHQCRASSPAVKSPREADGAAMASSSSRSMTGRLTDGIVVQGVDGDDRCDVLGLGQAIVDYSVQVDDATLGRYDVGKGERRVIDDEECASVLAELRDACTEAAGSSLSNSLVAVAALSAAAALPSSSSPSRCRPSPLLARPSGPSGREPCSDGGGGLRVAMGGSIGRDDGGRLFKAELARSGVDFLSDGGDSCTGTVVVMTTADAQRSFLAHPPGAWRIDDRRDGSRKDDDGEDEEQNDDNDDDGISGGGSRLACALRSCQLLLVEGYLLEAVGGGHAVRAAIRAAKRAGGRKAIVGLTAGDALLVHRRRSDFLATIDAGVDLLFANRAEASALLGKNPGDLSAGSVAARLAEAVRLVAVTDGPDGSYLAMSGGEEEQHGSPAITRTMHVPACPTAGGLAPVDTSGAGDAYAGGIVCGLLAGMGLEAMGMLAARAASAVIAKREVKLTDAEAGCVVAEMWGEFEKASAEWERGACWKLLAGGC